MSCRFYWNWGNFLFGWSYAKRKKAPNLKMIMICFGFLTLVVEEKIKVK